MSSFSKGGWDINSPEFKERDTLNKILLAEAIQSELGIFLLELKEQYIKEKCPYKKGDEVYYKEDWGEWKCGSIIGVQFRTTPCRFEFHLRPLNKGFTKPKNRRHAVWVHGLDKIKPREL